MLEAIALLVLANVVLAARSMLFVFGSRDEMVVREPEADLPFLSIVVPARNEERQIEGCVRSLLAQRYPAFEVIVVDDESDDETASIVARIAKEHSQLRLIHGAPLPQGWVGKSWALVQGERAARGEWLLCTDADTVHHPLAASSAVQTARERNVGALSLLTTQEMKSFSERALLPAILWTIVLATGHLAAIGDPRKRAAMFNGQYLLLSRALYEATDGHAVVANEIAEDLEFARHLKRDGRFRITLLGANDLVRTRMYRSFAEIWSGFVKNFALGMRERTAEAVAGLFGLALISPITPLAVVVLLLFHRWALAGVLAVAFLAGLFVAELGMRRMRFPAGSCAWLPAGFVVLLAICATSVARLTGSVGVDWRGRRYRGVLRGS
ncbi:MAG TPA: glycosyltransferase [Candidatus Dormibacteraeota bacterium]|nr:glycosyltransferase [Candidatus Dormibacteraeota bacterium]